MSNEKSGSDRQAESLPKKPDQWFRRGAENLRAFAWSVGWVELIEMTKNADCYLCPLCLRPMTNAELRDGTLTLEHVPPKSQGGSEVTLTCRECNHELGGSKVDVHVASERRLSEFFAGESSEPEDLRALTVDDVTIRADWYIGPDSI